MSRVTSKLQVTIPKVIARQYGIAPGGEIDWLPAGEGIRVVLRSDLHNGMDPKRRLELFDMATERVNSRESKISQSDKTSDRGWQREDLYDRGLAD